MKKILQFYAMLLDFYFGAFVTFAGHYNKMRQNFSVELLSATFSSKQT